MSHITASENWLFEVKEVRAIKAKSYGERYTANVRLVIVNGELSIEGMLVKEGVKLKLSDIKEIEHQIKEIGFNEYFYIRYKNGEKIKVKKSINLRTRNRKR